eukprot:3863513-Rhodomonas_salina.2
MGHFFYSLKAFDVLERLDPNPGSLASESSASMAGWLTARVAIFGLQRARFMRLWRVRSWF